MKLSVIIPIYNMEKYLAACLDSVIEPTVGDYEIIAVDDGSTDGSAAILRDYAARYPDLIRTVRQENGGLGCARNTGLRHAGGDYILFLDSDDTLVPGALPLLMNELSRGMDVLIFDFVSVAEDGRQLSETRGCGREGAFLLEDYPALLLEAPSAWNKLWRRSLFGDGEIRFPDRLWFEDLATSPRLYLRAGSFYGLHRPCIRYLQRSGSITRARDPGRNLEIIEALGTVRSFYRSAGREKDFSAELEELAIFHELLMSSARICLRDPAHPALDLLLNDFLAQYPDFRKNPYYQKAGKQHRLLIRLLLHRKRRAVRLLLKANNRLKGKDL